MTKKILIITYPFPPASYVGVFRTLKYCKFLQDFGWQPIVVAPRYSKNGAYYNAKLLEQIPTGVEIHWTRDVDPAKWFAGKSLVSKIIKKALNYILPLIGFPDSHIYWAPFSFLKAYSILRRNDISLLYSTSPPHSSHIVTYCLKKIFRTKYVLDFRDPWCDEVYLRHHKKPWFYEKNEKALYKMIVRNADKVIAVTKGERDEIKEICPDEVNEKFTYITNGFDSDDFPEEFENRRMDDDVVITYLGTVYKGMLDDFFSGVYLLLDNQAELRQRLRVNFVGAVCDDIVKICEEFKLTSIVNFVGYLAHKDALKTLFASDLLLVSLGNGIFPPSEIPAKTFEYLYARKPVLAIAPEGDLTRLLRECNVGLIVEPGKPEQVAEKIGMLVRAIDSGEALIQPSESSITQYERRNLTRQLADVLDVLLETECSKKN